MTNTSLSARILRLWLKELLWNCSRLRIAPTLTWLRGLCHALEDSTLLIFSANKYNVQCPICGWAGPVFFSVVNVPFRQVRRHEMCPKCESLARHRAIAEALLRLLATNDSGDLVTVLHVAPKVGSLSEFVRRAGRISLITVDLELPEVSARMDLHNLGFLGECFDFVICSHVLEHVRNDRACMAELRRVLKTGGLAFLPVPLSQAPNTIEFEIPTPPLSGHVRSYGLDYFDRLREVGFDPIPSLKDIAGAKKG